jgi:hypothetical protein
LEAYRPLPPSGCSQDINEHTLPLISSERPRALTTAIRMFTQQRLELPVPAARLPENQSQLPPYDCLSKGTFDSKQKTFMYFDAPKEATLLRNPE